MKVINEEKEEIMRDKAAQTAELSEKLIEATNEKVGLMKDKAS